MADVVVSEIGEEVVIGAVNSINVMLNSKSITITTGLSPVINCRIRRTTVKRINVIIHSGLVVVEKYR